jgi:hypothetical protein
MDKEKLSIEYPDEAAIRSEIASIVASGLPPKVSYFSFITSMYKRLGFNTLFRDRTEIVFVMILTIAVITFMALGSQASFEKDEGRVYSFVFIISPILYLVISLLFFANMKQRDTFELEMTFKYNVYQLAALRMLVFSIGSMAFNAMFIFVLAAEYEQLNVLQANLISMASLTLFSVGFLFVMIKSRSSFAKYSFVGGWLVINLVINSLNEPFYKVLVNSIPVYVYAAVILICFISYVRHLHRLIDYKNMEGSI